VSAAEVRDVGVRINPTSNVHAGRVEALARHWPFALIALCIAAFFALFAERALTDLGPKSYLLMSYDLHSYFLPRFALGSEELLSGRWPLWNAYEFGGLPFLATAQPAVFYPPKILLFGVLPPVPAYWAFLILHYLLCAGGFLLLAREHGLGKLASFVGAALWVFSLAILISNYHPNRIANLCWVPLCFLFATRLTRRATLADFIGLTCTIALQITAGYPEFVLDTLILLALAMLLQRITSREPRLLALPWALLAGAAALAALMTSAQLLPLMAVAGQTERGVLAEQTSQVVSNLIAPTSLYWPPAFLTLMALALGRRAGWAAAVQAAFCVFIVAGGWLLLRSLPGFALVRFPYAWSLLTAFPFAWLGAIGTDNLLNAGSDSRVRRRALGLAALLGSCLAAAYSLHRGLFIASVGPLDIITTLPSALLGVLGSSLLAAFALEIQRGRGRPWLVLAAALTLILSHLGSYPFGTMTASVERPGRHGQLRQLLGNDEPIAGRALSMHDILHGYNLTDRIPSLFGAEESFLPWGQREIARYFGVQPALKAVDWEKLSLARGFLDAMNLQYMVAPSNKAGVFINRRLEFVRTTPDGLLLSNPTRMGTAWVNHAVRVIPDPAAARRYVLGPSFDPRREVVLEKAPQRPYPTDGDARATAIKSERRPSPTELELEVELPRPGILVVSESAYAGWQAQVNGRWVSWQRANCVLRALELEAGLSRVRFVYRPSEFRGGLAMSGIGVGGVLLLGCIALRRRLRAARRITAPPARPPRAQGS